ncbi:MAG: type II toxin-antitoxin system HicA family toxin [Bryobacteraceae bacterium]
MCKRDKFSTNLSNKLSYAPPRSPRERRHCGIVCLDVEGAPRISGSDLIAALAKAGFRVVRIRGSHHFLRREDGRSAVFLYTPKVSAAVGLDRGH